MAAEDDPTIPDHTEDIQPINVADEIKNSFLDYSMSVIISRALPDVRDGLKPSQRRLLYAMFNDLSLAPNKAHLKCARIVGDTMGKYHPHGDQAIYPTLVNMAQPWTMRDILVDGQGNFGSVEGDPPAAMRYTEARLTHLGVALMQDMDKDTVDFVPNYDETNTEPTVLPAAFPNLLVNGGTGIAVGMATNIPPHNLVEVIEAICQQIDNPQITVEEIGLIIKGPDFPTGCTILGFNGIKLYQKTGRGGMRVRGTASIEEMKGNREQIIITEIPYNVNRATLCERIGELATLKILPEISGVRDESDENTRVVIDLKRDARSQVVLNSLYKHTALESSFSVNMLAIDNRRPKLLNIKEALTCYIEHRRQVILRRTRYLLGEAERRAERLEALLLALGRIDDFIQMIRDSASREEAKEKIKAYKFTHEAAESLGILIRGQASIVGDRYVFTDVQVNHILELRLYQLTALERDKIKADYDAILEEIKDLLDILAKESRVLQIIKDELNEIKEKHGTPRLTRIEADPGEMNVVDFIANDAMVVTLTHRGYIKRTNVAEYRAQRRGGKGLRGMATRDTDEGEEEDFVEHLFTAQAHDYLLFFTNTGRVYVERVFQVPEMPRTSRGRSIKNLLDLQPDEKIAATLRIVGEGENDRGNTFTDDYFIFFATRSGRVKRTCLSEFRNYRAGGIKAINIEEGNELIEVKLTNGDNDICLITSNGYSVRFNENATRSMGRASRGVTGVRPREGDYLVALVVVDESAQLLVASERGLGKRTSFGEYPTKGRGGKGMITMKVTEKTGKVISAVAVTDEDELMLMTNSGQSVRIPVSEIRETGRNAQGVKLINLADGEQLQDLARVPKEDVADDESESGLEANAESDTQESSEGGTATEHPEATEQPPSGTDASEEEE
ncbi:MAG: DNA gyrase subunit A [Verrucomicrobiae bacterium]|nr:DNA gyrase subunit A [Verrucomicrobiae bacterium]